MFKVAALTLALASVGSVVKAAGDPTKWTANSQLHQSLWGIAYTYVLATFILCERFADSLRVDLKSLQTTHNGEHNALGDSSVQTLMLRI